MPVEQQINNEVPFEEANGNLSDLQTPEKMDSQESSDSNSPNENASGSKSRGNKYRRQLDENGKPKKNFYNPPGKVMRHLAQQSYYDNFYGNQGQFYTLKQKYKTQMCKHFMENSICPLKQFCQFAHGPNELRQSNDPLPKNFGKTALGAVHSNYKTEPCKNFHATGECKFGEGCSFFHDDEERRALIDPLPNLPDGVTLPPMPEKLKNYRAKKNDFNDARQNGQNMSPQHFNPMTPMIQI